MTFEKLAFDGGTPVRAKPMLPRIGFGLYAIHGTLFPKLISVVTNE